MAHIPHDDTLWQQALDWILREHEQPLDPDEAVRLSDWLNVDEAHQRAYAEARHVWFLTGLVPPTTMPSSQEDPPPDPDAPRR